MKSIRFPLIFCMTLLLAAGGSWDASAQKKKSKVDSPSSKELASYNYEVETVGVGTEGTKVIKIWAYDKTVDGATQFAKKLAVAACIYRGLPASSDALATPALCPNPGEEWNDFFVRFFSEGGEYLNYVNITSDGVPGGQDRLKTKTGYKVGVYVQVLFDRLRVFLEDKGVIKSMNSWF